MDKSSQELYDTILNSRKKETDQPTPPIQFFVQMLVDIAGVGDEGDGYAFVEDWFDTIDKAVGFVKEHNQGTLRLVSMRMFTGTKPKE